MNALGQATHLTRARRMTISSTIKGEQGSRNNSGYSFGLYKPQEEFDDVRVGGVASRPQEFSGGFVDFLLGRGGRNPR
jgi:hypothetical protein